MPRSFITLAAALAVLLPLASAANADHRHRSQNILDLDLGAALFGNRGQPRLRIEFGQPGQRSWQLDEDLGRALEQLRRDLTLRQTYEPIQPERRAVDPEPRREIEVARLPAPGTQPLVSVTNARPIIEEEAVLGRIDLLTEAAPAASPTGKVRSASANDVVRYGPEAFAEIVDPTALGLPEPSGSDDYFRLNGEVVALDDKAQLALLTAALTQVLNQ